MIIGFTDRQNSPKEVGALLLGYYDKGELRYAGSVGTGWNSSTGRDLHAKLTRLQSAKPAFEAASVTPGRSSRRARGSEKWVKPQLVVEVAFTEWTPEGHVRHPSFKGLRNDKPPTAISRERAKRAPGRTKAGGDRGAEQVR